jgi:PAS domain S-box-containing protein
VVTWLLAAIERVASAGTARARTLAEARQVRVANTLALLCVAICAFSLPYDAVVAPPWVVIEDIVGVVMFAASPLLAARGLQRTARAMLLVTATLFVAFNALVLGKASGQHLLLLPLAVLPFMLFGHHERRQMLAASVCIGASILVIEVWGFDLVGRVVERPALSPHYETYSTLVVLVVLILSIRNFVVAHALTEDALRAEQERYRLITETARDAIVTIGANSRVVFASPASEGVFGTPPSALLDRDVDSLFTEALARAPTGGARLAVRADGARVPVEVSIGESRVDSGVRTLIIRDVTDRIRDQEQVDQARANAAASARLAALGVMSGGIAHEINNPLTALALAADRLRRHADSGTVTATDVGYTADRIRRITGRIDKIVSGLRFFARDGAGDAMEPTRLRELIDDTIDLCQDRFRQHAVELQIAPFPDELTLECRGVQISQVLVNLLTNAHDAVVGSSAPWVRLGVTHDADAIVIDVTDSNPGLAPEVRDRVFEPFFTTKPLGKGTGLGLSVSHGIVLSHHGRIEVDAECEHTRFVVTLPRRQPAQPPGARDASAA